jgi:hypothetical protein
MKKEFKPYHAQMDYETDIVDVQYEGDYDRECDNMEAIKYAKQSYPQLQGIIIYSYPPSEVKGYNNVGIIGIK